MNLTNLDLIVWHSAAIKCRTCPDGIGGKMQGILKDISPFNPGMILRFHRQTRAAALIRKFRLLHQTRRYASRDVANIQ